MDGQDCRRTVVHGLEVVDEGQDVSVADRDSFQHGDLVSDHMLSSRHESLVDDFGGIVSSGVDVDAFFDDRVRTRAQRLAGLVAAWLYHWFLRWLSHVDECGE